MVEHAAPVFETIERSGLNPSVYLVFGGAAMAMHGIHRPAHDVDLLVEGTVFRKLASDLLTPHGLPLRPEENDMEEGQARLVSAVRPDRNSLPLDLWSLTGLKGTAKFSHWMERAVDLQTDQGTMRVMDLSDILRSKKKSPRVKDQLDARRIHKHLKQSKSLELNSRLEHGIRE